MVRSRITFVCVFLLFVCIGEKIALAKFTESRTETASHHMDDVMGTTINGPSYGHVLQDSKKTLAQIESAKKDKGNHGSLSLNEAEVEAPREASDGGDAEK
uniref:PREDICTED: CLAVATA3/ESR (CLE)-related n=1 Tax=Ascaris lumbricoides TaxID=6252 RepID=A0A0M3HT79_ASCLU